MQTHVTKQKMPPNLHRLSNSSSPQNDDGHGVQTKDLHTRGSSRPPPSFPFSLILALCLGLASSIFVLAWFLRSRGGIPLIAHNTELADSNDLLFSVYENRYFNSKNREDFVLSTCNVSSNKDLCKSNIEGTLSDNTTVDFGLINLKLPDSTILQLTSEPTACLQCISLVPLEIHSQKGLEVLELEHKLLGSGAHRELSTKLTIRSQNMIACDLVTLEKLSSSVFVDVFQLQGLVARQVYADVQVYGDHNLELPAMHSSQSVVAVHTAFSPQSAQTQKHNVLQAEVTLPLHARYPPLNMRSHNIVDLLFPNLLIQCAPVEDTSLTRNDRGGINHNHVPWTLLSVKSNSSTLLQWAVPAGNLVHTEFVAVTTATTALAGVALLLLVASCSSSLKRAKTA